MAKTLKSLDFGEAAEATSHRTIATKELLLSSCIPVPPYLSSLELGIYWRRRPVLRRWLCHSLHNFARKDGQDKTHEPNIRSHPDRSRNANDELPQ